MSITVNTNLSSLICQRSLSKATMGMNTALQRMSTGLRINSAKDDAAGMAISTTIDSRLSSYAVAQDNAQMGQSLLNTASGSLSEMSSMLQRMRDLAEKSANGTYGEEERKAMQAEVSALAKELERVKNTTEFNGIKLFEANFKETNDASSTTTVIGSYEVEKMNIDEIKDKYGADAIVVDSTMANEIANGSTSVTDNKVYILAANNDKALQNILQGNKKGKTILASDITCTQEWTAVGNSSGGFRGTFDGNGYKISNVTINKSDTDYQGFFGYVDQDAAISNVSLINIDIKGKNYTGGLIGYFRNKATVENCTVQGKIEGANYTGGLIGQKQNSNNVVKNCDANIDVQTTITTGSDNAVGGLIGYQRGGGEITNCYVKGTITNTGINTSVGGFIGKNDMGSSKIENCYSEASVNVTVTDGGRNCIGGFIGNNINTGIINNCYSSGKVTATVEKIGYSAPNIGGFCGWNINNTATITNCYTKSNIDASINVTTNKATYISGFCGKNESTGELKTSYASNKINLLTPSAATSINGFSSENNPTTVTDCYWDTTTGGILTSGSGTGKTTQELQLNSDFTYPDTWTNDSWGFSKGYYPRLKFEPAPASVPELKSVNLQVGVNADKNSVVKVSTGLAIKDFNVDILEEKKALEALAKIDSMLQILTNSQTNIGAAMNRLDSVMEFQSVQMSALTSATSLIKDADIAKESASYIKNQILQQTTATLLATANQNPSIALSLV